MMARKSIKRSSPPLYPEHPVTEHAWRLKRARQVMEEQNLDVLLLARNVNVFYFSGSRFVFVGMDAPVALAPQSTVIITKDADVYCQRFGPFDNDEVALQTTVSESLESYDDEFELVNILKEYGVSRGDRIGTEWGAGLCGGINPLKFLDLKGRLETELGVEVVDGNPAVWKITSVRSQLEIERMKVAVEASCQAMKRVYEVIEIGQNELEIARLAKQFMLEAGADGVSHAQVMSEGDTSLKLMSCDAVDRPIEKGWIHLDMGAKYKRYTADINRGIFLGRRPTPMEKKMYACRLGVSELLDNIIKPGVAIDDVVLTAQKYIEDQGCILREVGGVPFLGHAIGMEPYQRPNLVPSEAQPEMRNTDGKVLFEPGMMFTYEMMIDMPGESLPFFNIEDNVVVTETGVENMSGSLSRELEVKL